MTHEEYMRRALELSLRGTGRVSPNPLVGAVIVKNGRIIGEGWHAVFGSLHAERAALENCRSRGEDPAGADIYVTLEPCCHHGKQPPCTDALIEAGIRRVFTGCGDPNPKVAGKGIRILKEHGIEVTEHLLEEECRKVNEVFFHYITTGLPLVVLKYAMTLDGKTACFTGASRWVTGEAARRHVHETRNRLTAIMAGVGTVLTDDPLLTCRLGEAQKGRDPVRIICDSSLRTPLTAKVVTTARETPTILATCCRDKEKQAPYIAAGCRILECGDARAQDPPGTAPASPRVDLKDLAAKLGAEGIDSILLEGGGTLAANALREGILQEADAFIAPKFFGGRGHAPMEGEGVALPEEAWKLEIMEIQRYGDDFFIRYRVKEAEDVYGDH